MYKIIQQRNKCIGCNACVEAAPQRWVVSRLDGKSTLVGGVNKRGMFNVNIPDWELEENKRAQINCPVHIIDIIKL
ncbi:MAG: ferredoxin [Bacteroidia bacterium]|jgi:ferredoxin|nr:ferredoxin [Bacteroidia bacterium]MCF8425413.1 ferredoxin [Bacteroidia bacterium]MCF8447105.1 ferredoxin [Bacteroidia bacterium]